MNDASCCNGVLFILKIITSKCLSNEAASLSFNATSLKLLVSRSDRDRYKIKTLVILE